MSKKIVFIFIILCLFIIIIIKNKEGYKEGYNDDVISRQALNNITSVYAESYGTVYFNNQYNLNDLLVGNNLYVNGRFNLLPRGVIVAFNNSVAPFGWAICDGTNGTPDLRGRFILGQNKDQPEVSPIAVDGGKPLINQNVRVGPDMAASLNTTGGEVYHKLTISEMPKHNHNLTTITSAAGNKKYLPIGTQSLSPTVYDTIPDSGENEPHNILPPFYVLTYIMKL
jgi:microcystin-dependent protein